MGNMRFKVGDRVRIKSLDWYNKNKSKSHGTVACAGKYFDYDMREWCGKTMTIIAAYTTCYIMKEDGRRYLWTDEMFEGLVEEEEIEFTEEDKYWCDIMSESDPTTYVLPEGYIFKDENGNVINATKIVLEKKKKEYPKTYEECLPVLEIYNRFPDVEVYNAKPSECKLFESLIRLKRCRDAYWKIAGEEMGLEKPWEYDCNRGYFTPAIIYRNGYIQKVSVQYRNAVLSFPTEEMRDAFYENFKDLIESVKELL